MDYYMDVASKGLQSESRILLDETTRSGSSEAAEKGLGLSEEDYQENPY